ncbi:hypothetical protein SO802_024123 [Lithocarpus litseifolius]|uniref:Uncharacterized protein n=1 Tax=Lithocarpus litseifolius TaxID=425828 RepID=A0AAW2CBM1_9ROSI
MTSNTAATSSSTTTAFDCRATDSVSEEFSGQPGSAGTTEHRKFLGSRSKPEREMGIRDTPTPAAKNHAHLAGHVPDEGDGSSGGGFGGTRFGVGLSKCDCFVTDTGFDVARYTRRGAVCGGGGIRRSPESGSADQETTHRKRTEEEFIDEELNIPSLLVDMAEREMLVIKSA